MLAASSCSCRSAVGTAGRLGFPAPTSSSIVSHLPSQLHRSSQLSVSDKERKNIAAELKRCPRFGDLEVIHSIIIKKHGHEDSFLMNQMITVSSSFARIDYSILLFTDAKGPNVFVFNAMIGGLIRCSLPAQALLFYMHEMLPTSIVPTSFTFSSLVQACKLLHALDVGEAIHARIWKYGFDSHLFLQTGLLDLYAVCGKIDELRQTFNKMPEKDDVTWATLVSAHALMGNLSFAEKVFEEMPQRSNVSWNAMIAAYARIGDVDMAASFFNKMPSKDVVSWTTMITSYSQSNRFREAAQTFCSMRLAGIVPDEVTLAAVISACAHLGDLDFGKEVHIYATQNGFKFDVCFGSALIDMYSKCGDINRSLVVFYKLQQRNLFCWNSMIEGLAVHGFAREALNMFATMEKVQIKPNGITFMSVLTACTHAGLVEEGRKNFSLMISGYSLKPEMSHYGCMVDLLSRAGLVEDAMALIKSMEMEPSSAIWGALLGGCKIHRNLEIGLFAIGKLMILEPDSCGYYALVLSMYADANKWLDVANVRGVMKQRGVFKKSPAQSWIEVEGTVHEFLAYDVAHPYFDKICCILMSLHQQSMLAFHTPQSCLNL